MPKATWDIAQPPTQPTVSERLARQNEMPQPAPDDTAVNRAWMRQYQADMAPMPGRPGGIPADSGGLPGDNTPPSRMPCMSLSGSDVVAIAADPLSDEIFVATDSNLIDVLARDGVYWVRVGQADPGEAVTALSAYGGRLVAAGVTQVHYWDNWRDKNTQRSITQVANDVHVNGVDLDSDPEWPSKVSGLSYQTESRPTAYQRGNYADLRAAVDAGAFVGYAYFNTTVGGFREIDGIGAGTENQLSWSEDFVQPTTWLRINATTTTDSDSITSTTGRTIPASKVIPNATSTSAHLIEQNVTGAFSLSDEVRVRVVAKADGYDYLRLRLEGINNVSIWYNLRTGEITKTLNTFVDAKISALGNGWYLCEVIAVVSAAANVRVQCYIAPDDLDQAYSGDGTSGVLLTASQAVLTSYTGDYFPTTDADAESTITRLGQDNFPEQILVVGTDNVLDVYDCTGDDPDFWMRFNVSGGNMVPLATVALVYREGRIHVGGPNPGLTIADYAIDTGDRFSASGYSDYNSTIEDRNAGSGWTVINAAQALAAGNAADVDAVANTTVNGPLFETQVAVSTTAGISVVERAGTSADIAGQTDAPEFVNYYNDGLAFSGTVSKHIEINPVPSADITAPGQRIYRSTDENAIDPNTPHILNELGGAIKAKAAAARGYQLIAGSVDGVSIINLQGQLAGSRVTSTGDTRVTSQGDRRVTNG